MSKKLEEMTLEELWQLFPIELVPHRNEWSTWYEEEALAIMEFMDGLQTAGQNTVAGPAADEPAEGPAEKNKATTEDITVHDRPNAAPDCSSIALYHIGSTAIPDIYAKNIVDILMVVGQGLALEQVSKRLVSGGWIQMSAAPDRISLNKGYTPEGYAERVFHLHLRRPGDTDELAFCSYMCAHPEAAAEYEALKTRLAGQYRNDRDAYTEAKGEFIRKYTEIAKHEQPENAARDTADRSDTEGQAADARDTMWQAADTSDTAGRHDGLTQLLERAGLTLEERPDGLVLTDGVLELKWDFTGELPRLKHNNLTHEFIVKASLGKKSGLSGRQESLAGTAAAGSNRGTETRTTEAGNDRGTEIRTAEATMPVALDATAGLGGDSILLAAAGFRVEMYERNPVIAALLKDALNRAAEIPELAEIVSHMHLHEQDSIEALRALEYVPDVVILDPMFPERQKSASVKKKFQLLQRLESPCTDEEELMRAATSSGAHKIVVKRPLKGPYLAGVRPAYSLEGKAVRYDCIVQAAKQLQVLTTP